MWKCLRVLPPQIDSDCRPGRPTDIWALIGIYMPDTTLPSSASNNPCAGIFSSDNATQLSFWGPTQWCIVFESGIRFNSWLMAKEPSAVAIAPNPRQAFSRWTDWNYHMEIVHSGTVLCFARCALPENGSFQPQQQQQPKGLAVAPQLWTSIRVNRQHSFMIWGSKWNMTRK